MSSMELEGGRYRRTSGSVPFIPSCVRRKTMTCWNLLPAVILNTLVFMIGAEPMDLKRTITVGW
jgi:hypothetical protein